MSLIPWDVTDELVMTPSGVSIDVLTNLGVDLLRTGTQNGTDAVERVLKPLVRTINIPLYEETMASSLRENGSKAPVIRDGDTAPLMKTVMEATLVERLQWTKDRLEAFGPLFYGLTEGRTFPQLIDPGTASSLGPSLAQIHAGMVVQTARLVLSETGQSVYRPFIETATTDPNMDLFKGKTFSMDRFAFHGHVDEKRNRAAFIEIGEVPIPSGEMGYMFKPTEIESPATKLELFALRRSMLVTREATGINDPSVVDFLRREFVETVDKVSKASGQVRPIQMPIKALDLTLRVFDDADGTGRGQLVKAFEPAMRARSTQDGAFDLKGSKAREFLLEKAMNAPEGAVVGFFDPKEMKGIVKELGVTSLPRLRIGLSEGLAAARERMREKSHVLMRQHAQAPVRPPPARGGRDFH